MIQNSISQWKTSTERIRNKRMMHFMWTSPIRFNQIRLCPDGCLLYHRYSLWQSDHRKLKADQLTGHLCYAQAVHHSPPFYLVHIRRDQILSTTFCYWLEVAAKDIRDLTQLGLHQRGRSQNLKSFISCSGLVEFNSSFNIFLECDKAYSDDF